MSNVAVFTLFSWDGAWHETVVYLSLDLKPNIDQAKEKRLS